MTRRQRHARIIDSFGRDRERYHLAEVLARHGRALLTDEGLEMLARSIVTGHKRQQRFNRENRARRTS
jgi:hypothetical protein